MGVTHHQCADRRIALDQVCGPGRLSGGGDVDHLGMRGDEFRIVAEALGDAEADARWNHAKGGDRQRHVEDAVQHGGDAMLLVDAITVDCQDAASADLETQLARMKGDAGFGAPECVAPAVVVAADHQHRQPARQLDNAGGDPDAVSRDQAFVGEPEVVDIAGKQERIADRRDGIEKREERRLVGSVRGAQVGVSNNYESATDHGAKGGRCRTLWQPMQMVSRQSGVGSTTPKPTSRASSTTPGTWCGWMSRAPNICASPECPIAKWKRAVFS